MSVAILRSNGLPIKTDSLSNLEFDVYGFLIEFTANVVNDNVVEQNVKYRHFQNNDFRSEDRSRSGIEGYYRDDKFNDYYNYLTFEDAPTITELISNKCKFNFDNIKAQAGDSITVSMVDPGMPYNFCYNQTLFTFNIENTADNKGLKNYKKPVYDGLVWVDYEIDIPANATKVSHDANISGSSTAFFYAKNFGDAVDNWTTVNNVDKAKFKRIVLLIAFKRFWIVNDIFSKIFLQTDLSIIDAEADSTDLSMSSFASYPGDTDLFKAIFLLKKSWGIYYSPTASPELVQRTSFDAVLSSTPNYAEYQNYFEGLVNFYNIADKQRNRLLIADPSVKLNYLLRLLPPSSLSLFPFSVITSVLTELMKKKSLSDRDQDFIIQLAYSFENTENIDAFLDFLLKKGDGSKTNFEVLYNNLSDARLSRIPIVGLFVNDQTYRKYFVLIVYQLWQKSKYNFSYFPPGTPGSGPVNLGSYFVLNIGDYNPNNVLTFKTSDNSLGTDLTMHVDTEFTSEFDGKKININLVEFSRIDIANAVVSDPISGGVVNTIPLGSNTSLFGSFHFYQPISIVGFHANLTFRIPQKCLVPAFLFHYAEEYKRLADFDAAIALAINLTIDVIAAFFTEGASLALIEDLSYLRYLPRLGKAMLGIGDISGTELIQVFKGLNSLEVVSGDAITISASSLLSVNQYLISTETNPDRAAVLQGYQEIFFGLLILSITDNVLTRSRITTVASEILPNVLNTTIINPATFNPDLIDLVKKLAGTLDTATGNFETKLAQLSLDNIVTKYDALTNDLKLKFYNDFRNLSAGEWAILNEDNGIRIINWQTLVANDVAEATNLTFLKNADSQVTNIIRLYQYSQIKAFLQTLSKDDRALYLSNYGDSSVLSDTQLANLNSAPDIIKFSMDGAKPPIASEKASFNTADFIKILNSNLGDFRIRLLAVANRIAVVIDHPDFLSIAQDPAPEALQTLFNKNRSTLSSDLQVVFDQRNRLDVTTQISLNGNLIQGPTLRSFISSTPADINGILEALPGVYTEPDDDGLFQIFVSRAVDFHGVRRGYDTELKWLYYFMENEYPLGDHFVITLSSVLWACSSCQRYLVALQRLAKLDGKIIEIQFVAYKQAKNISSAKKLF